APPQNPSTAKSERDPFGHDSAQDPSRQHMPAPARSRNTGLRPALPGAALATPATNKVLTASLVLLVFALGAIGLLMVLCVGAVVAFAFLWGLQGGPATSSKSAIVKNAV